MCVCVCVCVYARARAHMCAEVLCVCANEYVCAPLCLGTPTLLRCRGVQDQQIVKEE